MECLVPGANIKVLGKALQALSKVGDELYMEAQNEELSLIVLNSSKTVCSRFRFFDTFFSSYEVNQEEIKISKNSTITCKVQMKVFLPLFKGNLEKKLDYIKLEYTTDSDFLLFKMKYKSDEIVMVHKLRLMETETLSIGVSTNSGSNNLTASSTFSTQFLTVFNTSDDEVTFEINQTKIVARNYCIGTPCRPKMMRTQINLNSTEFLNYNITKDTTINFSLKPLRTLVHFAETFSLDVGFNFETGGKPLCLILKNPTFEVNFIVATLDPYTDSNSTIATTSIQSKNLKNRISDLSVEDLDALESENWENDVSKQSSFVELMKNSKNTKNDLDVVPRSPESPRSKKAKTVFGRCYDPTFHETILGEVLAGNSDSD